jgi:DNA-binding response OmpR family regulator
MTDLAPSPYSAELSVSTTRVLLIEPNAALRSAIVTVLDAEGYEVEVCRSLDEAILRSRGSTPLIALVAWQSMQGLLAEQHRQRLVQVTRHLQLVPMVPRRWLQLLDRTDLGVAVAALIAKPFEADELLGTIERVRRVTASAST